MEICNSIETVLEIMERDFYLLTLYVLSEPPTVSIKHCAVSDMVTGNMQAQSQD